MSKKSEPSNANNLKGLRQQIDKFDLQILELLNKRASIASQIGKAKTDSGAEVFSAAREAEVIHNVLDANKGPLAEVSLRAIFRELISGSRAIQRVQKVAFLGPEYSYSHIAALERFGESVEYMRVGTISAVFEELNRKHIDLGVVPLENTTDGRIADTLDCFIRNPEIRICAEIRIKVHHHLLANCEQTEIRRVYSKAQAISQCRNWLSKNLPHATTHEVNSTADAARLAQSEPYAAAVASRQAGVRYGLRTLFSNIEDFAGNETRFAIIGLNDSARTGQDKTALMFQIGHQPGTLADVLAVFKQNKINLTWIESFPYPEAKGEYVFFLDFEGHREDPKIKKALGSLDKLCDLVNVLGSYPVAAMID
jgi:chorismate mutase/prephenate dehydratase